jgi:diacylglycerol diphosphate phosphatase / phosphatidate phosphatase
MSAYQTQQLPTHEPQAQRFTSQTRLIRNVQLNRDGFSLFLSNLKHWFIDTWLDWVTLIIIGATAAGVWVAPHTFDRLFPVTFTSSGDIVFPGISYPYVEPIFDSTLAGILNAAIPIFVISLSQLWLQSFHKWANGILGLLYALATGTCFQVILKKTIGGLRPHFLSVCEPVIPSIDAAQGQGFQNIMYTIDICTGDKDRIDNALESFPSGHAQIAFAGMGYLAIYLFCHLRIRNVSRRRPSHWRMCFVVAPLLFATYLASTLVLGYHHHGHDVIFGGLIGFGMAMFGYRLCFASIFDPKWNTVPLVRGREGEEERAEERKLGGHGRDGVESGGTTRDVSPV